MLLNFIFHILLVSNRLVLYLICHAVVVILSYAQILIRELFFHSAALLLKRGKMWYTVCGL